MIGALVYLWAVGLLTAALTILSRHDLMSLPHGSGLAILGILLWPATIPLIVVHDVIDDWRKHRRF